MTDVGTGTLALQATTGTGGFTLANSTPDIITWQCPSDGGLHRVLVSGTKSITSGETGGAVTFTGTAVDGSALSVTAFAGGASTGTAVSLQGFIIKAGTTVKVHQQSALSGGASQLWAEIWGS